MPKKKDTNAENFDPSIPLENTKHEIFVTKLLGGMTFGKAYVAAGYQGRGTNAGGAGSRLAKNEDIKARLAWLKAQLSGEKIASRSRVLEVLTEVLERKVKQRRHVGGGEVIDIEPTFAEVISAAREIAQICGYATPASAPAVAGFAITRVVKT